MLVIAGGQRYTARMTEEGDRDVTEQPQTMRALVYERYGDARVMELRNVPVPVPRHGEVCVRVQASGLNSWDWDLLHGIPLVRMGAWFRPQYPILGCDVAGTVVSLGEGVRDFAVGDEVLGDVSPARWGGFAEYVCAPAALLARKPAALSFEQAAGIPQAGVLALQGLRAFGPLNHTHSVLIIGAGGGVGSFALQLAKAAGARVTVVDGLAKLPMLHDLGADDVIDFRREDVAHRNERFDVILDVVGKRAPRELLGLLSPGGRYVMVGGTPKNLIQALWLWLTRRPAVILIHKPNRDDLESLARLCDSGAIRPIIDRTCELRDVPDTIEQLGAGHIVGKAVMSFQATSGT